MKMIYKYTTSPSEGPSGTRTPGSLYMCIFTARRAMSMPPAGQGTTAMTRELASHRAMPMTFSKGVEDRTEAKGREKKKFSSGKPHCSKGTPVSWAGVAGIAGDGSQAGGRRGLIQLVETSLVGPFPGLKEPWLARPRMKPRVCGGGKEPRRALDSSAGGKTFLVLLDSSCSFCHQGAEGREGLLGH